MGFVHLHRHSDFSLLDGIGTAEHYAKRAADLGQESLALTDHGSLAGVLYHVEACEKHGVNPIIGMEAYFRKNINLDREEKNSRGYYHLVLLAKNQEGFVNLMRLSSESYLEDNFYQKPCVDWNILRKHSKGLIASSSCVSGLIPQYFLRDDVEEAEKTLRIFQDIFGDDFYLETQPHAFIEQSKVNKEIINLADRTGIPVVATVDAHYPFKDWHDTQDISLMIATGSSLKKRKMLEEAGKDYMAFTGESYWLMSEDEVIQEFQNTHDYIPRSTLEQMVSNSSLIAERCDKFVYDKSPKIPKATENESEAESILREWCVEGLQRIGKSGESAYVERIDEELSVMGKLGVFDYFVIVGDMVRWAKDQGIRVGPGRGSAAGSLVNYLIGITAIDPIGYDLLFERFLNEYRTELPDIDIDFQDDRRDEVKQYLIDKWGKDHVVNVAAFQSFGLKGVIQDVGRVLDVPYGDVMKATSQIPFKTFGMDMEDIEDTVPAVRSLFEQYPEVRKHSIRLFGQMRGQSRHAAAVIITDKPAQDLIPMMRDKEGGMVTQWTERANAQLISPYGFLKIDCLSTNGLTNQERTIKMIKERHGVDIDFEDVKQFPVIEDPLAIDPVVMDAFVHGNNIGIFQFESKGIVGLLKQIKPSNMEHIIAANALYRPGTLENQVAFEYAKRKNGLRWSLPHEAARQFIGYTFGYMIYQEQVMQIYRQFAKDATPAEAATFLKVVSKGIARDFEGKEKLRKYEDKFFEGCREAGLPESSYKELWDQILQMTTYAFNKSHSAGYALQAYQDMWLKTYYPLEFYASILSIETDKIPEIIKESKKYAIKILPPDINTSGDGFTIVGNSVRFGLLGVKNVGPSALKEILSKRPFDSYEDFFEKCEKAKVNKKVKNALFASGAFDSFGARDRWYLSDDCEKRISDVMSMSDKSAMEKEYIGFTISSRDDIDKFDQLISDTIDNPEKHYDDGVELCVGGEVTDFKEITTKKGDKMSFVTLSFRDYEFNLTIFPEQYKKYSRMFDNGNALLAIGDYDEERNTIVAKNICTAEQLAMEAK